MILAGYAAPFRQVAFVADERYQYETILPTAFDALLAGGKNVSLKFETHDDRAPSIASTRAGTLDLWQDKHGLAFEAQLADNRESTRIGYSLTHGCDGASVLFTKTIGGFDGDVFTIARAEIAHFTITSTPAYRGTSAFRADVDLARAPIKICSAAERWHAGRPSARQISAVAADREWQRTCARLDRIVDNAARVQRIVAGREKASPAVFAQLLRNMDTARRCQ